MSSGDDYLTWLAKQPDDRGHFAAWTAELGLSTWEGEVQRTMWRSWQWWLTVAALLLLLFLPAGCVVGMVVNR